MTSPAATAVRALTDARILAAVALLLINDQVLKQLYPGPITGKLSDFAGLAFFPLLLAAALGLVVKRPQVVVRASMLITAGWFIAIKTTPWAAELTESAVRSLTGNSHIVVDPTDLIALPAVLLAGLVFRDATSGRHRWMVGSRSALSPQQKRWLRVSALVAAGFAAVATSCVSSDGVTDVAEYDGVLYAWGLNSELIAFEGGWSLDGGTTWAEVPQQLPDAVIEDDRLSQVCLPDEANHCFQISGRPHVLESFDGGDTWQVAWELPPGRQEFLERNREGCDDYAIRSWDLLVTDGSAVLVAMGDDGVLRRDASGTWERDILGQAAPLSDPGRLIWGETVQVIGYLLIALLVAVLFARQLLVRQPSGAGWWTIVAVLAVVAFGATVSPFAASGFTAVAFFFAWGAVAYLMWAGRAPFGGWTMVGLAMLLGAGISLLAIVSVAEVTDVDSILLVAPVTLFIVPGLAGLFSAWPRLHEVDSRGAWQVGLVGNVGAAVTAGFVYWSFYAWSAGSIDRLSDATNIAGVGAIVGLASIAVAMYFVSRLSPTPRQSEPDAEVSMEEAGVAAKTDEEAVAAEEAVRAGRSPWLAALALAVGALFVWFYLPVAVGSYLAARWTGQRSPAARTLVALTVGVVMVFVTAGVGIGGAIWGVSVVSLRAPNRFAWVPRTALLATLIAASALLGALELPVAVGEFVFSGLLTISVPFVIVALDLWAARHASRRRGKSAAGVE